MRIPSFLKLVIAYILGALAFAVLLILSSHVVKPKSASVIQEYSPEELREAERRRDISLGPGPPPVVNLEVDLTEGETASWRPRGEAPILAALVKEGKLPPVAERVGPEPVVMKGIEGIGTYGGTWMRIANSGGDVGIVGSRFSYANLIRFSPQGYPIVPHIAKAYEISADNREFTFHLRRGMRWSDGQPYSADDILYWWEHECNDPQVNPVVPKIMTVRGKPGKIVKIDDHTVKIIFPEPYGLFPAKATLQLRAATETPAHYLRQYHPTLGDRQLIEQHMRARNLHNELAVYRDVKNIFNPEHPRLWPWLYRTYKSNPPQTFVRNPYFCAVDTEGNQLPYLDRMLFEVKSGKMLGISAANGEVSMQARHLRYEDYTHLMNQREQYGFQVYHWYPGDRSQYVISVNLNRRVDLDDPSTELKHELLNEKRFRQALSLAIDRQTVIEAEYNGQTKPAQVAPGPSSFFYEPKLYEAYTQHDPDRANRLLDDIGLTQRDREGYRTFRDGSRMTFLLSYCNFVGEGTGQFILDDWAKVGIRVILRERSRPLFYTEKAGLLHDLDVWGGNDEFFPLIEPRYLVPVGQESNYAIGFGRWYDRGGLYGAAKASRTYGCIEPPLGHPLRRAMEVYDATAAVSDPVQQRELFREVLLIAAENVWSINISTPPPVVGVVKNGFRNVPQKAVYNWDFQSPANFGIETFFFDEPHDSPGAITQMAKEILVPTPAPDVPSQGSNGGSGQVMTRMLQWTFIGILLCLVVMVGVRHPYVGRRLLVMIPTLAIISVVTFSVIQLPPGSFIESKIIQLQESGDEADLQQIEEIKEAFFLEDALWTRYVRWLGLVWFTSFDRKDAGLLQGNMGRSMETLRQVNQIVGDRILLTFLISLGTILFTWATAIPIGIYSAVRQYSVGDYVLTFAGFIGMCIPGFLLALLLMFVADTWLGMPISGLFSSQFGAQPEWNWLKVLDLLKHIWVPVVVLGVGGTASMIRVMRANLLDELRKPYVVTARAKGVRPAKLLFKYPVRLALNPFISGIGGLFPQLVSGGAIVAMVLSLPTVGPLMLDALMTEDFYLAGSMLMVLSAMGVMGTLVSDLLLLWVDPRIRFMGGTR